MQVKGDSSLNKLILLFVFDKMEVPLSENTVLDMCCSSNNWLAYMDCQPILNQLLDCGWIYDIGGSGEPLYTITTDGRICLANFFLNLSLRKISPSAGRFHHEVISSAFADLIAPLSSYPAPPASEIR